jgi:cytochrome bd-type quinol oxidase subunit 1
VTATFVRVKPIQHAAVLAGVIFVMAVISYQHYSGLQPRWYQAMMVVAPPLCAIAGAALYARNAPAMGR